METTSPTEPPPPAFRIRCKVAAARPVINIKTSTQKDAAQGNKSDVLPLEQFAPEHHKSLVSSYRKQIRDDIHHQWKLFEQGTCKHPSPLITHRIIMQIIAPAIQEDKSLRYHGATEYEIADLYQGPHPENLLATSADASDPDPAVLRRRLYDFACKTCIASDKRDLFLQLRQNELQETLASLTKTEKHQNDETHERRTAQLASAVKIDPETGHILLSWDETKFKKFMNKIISEQTGWYSDRLDSLRQKITQRALSADKYTGTKNAQELSDPFAASLSDKEAAQIFSDTLSAITQPPLLRRLLQIALDDENLNIYVASHNHCDYRLPDEHDETASIVRAWGTDKGIFLPKSPGVYTLAEELAHYAIGRLYKNDSLPFLSEADSRRTLLRDAIREGINAGPNGKSPLQFRNDFDLAGYSWENPKWHKPFREVPAKAAAMMAIGEWETLKTCYPAIDNFMNKVMAKDIEVYNREDHLEPLGPHATEALSIRSALRTSRTIPASPSRRSGSADPADIAH